MSLIRVLAILMLATAAVTAGAQSSQTKPQVVAAGSVVAPRADTMEFDKAVEAARMGNGFVCRSDSTGKTACICRTDAPADDHYSCNGMMKLCKRLGGGKKKDCEGTICACSFSASPA
jgi:hypothetical protein